MISIILAKHTAGNKIFTQKAINVVTRLSFANLNHVSDNLGSASTIFRHLVSPINYSPNYRA